MELLTKFLMLVGRAFKWAWKRPRMALEACLVAGLVFGGWLYNRKSQALDKVQKEAQGLEADLRMKLTITGNQLEMLRREGGKVTIRKVFVPPEGYVLVKQVDNESLLKEREGLIAKLKEADAKEQERIRSRIGEIDQTISDGTTVVVKKEGFTFKPGLGMEWGNRGIKPRLDFKWAYWSRYGFLFGGSENGIGTAISRRLDDIIWTKPQNIEWYINYNFIRFNGSTTVTTGPRMNF